jgi:hypothetical protein
MAAPGTEPLGAPPERAPEAAEPDEVDRLFTGGD